MPDSITVAAFVFGLVLIMAALVGKELKIAAVELPPLNRNQRLIVGVLGVVLVIFGLTEGQAFGWAVDQPFSVSETPRVEETSTNGHPTPVSLPNEGVPLPPEFAGNIRSAKSNFGCGVLLAVAGDHEAQLSICGSLPELPPEWIPNVMRVNVDCATVASDRIIMEVWTEANYSGNRWAYTFGC